MIRDEGGNDGWAEEEHKVHKEIAQVEEADEEEKTSNVRLLEPAQIEDEDIPPSSVSISDSISQHSTPLTPKPKVDLPKHAPISGPGMYNLMSKE